MTLSEPIAQITYLSLYLAISSRAGRTTVLVKTDFVTDLKGNIFYEKAGKSRNITNIVKISTLKEKVGGELK